MPELAQTFVFVAKTDLRISVDWYAFCVNQFAKSKYTGEETRVMSESVHGLFL
jgi:hypothetical protein